MQIIKVYKRKDTPKDTILSATNLITHYLYFPQVIEISEDEVKLAEFQSCEFPQFTYQQNEMCEKRLGNFQSLKDWFFELTGSSAPTENGNIYNDNESNNDIFNCTVNENSQENLGESSIGYLSQSLQTVEEIWKNSSGWVGSWFFAPSKNRLQEENNNRIRDFKAIKINWYWREQNRILRFDLDMQTFSRYDPFDSSLRIIHNFANLIEISSYQSSCYFIIKWKMGNSNSFINEHYRTTTADYPDILKLLNTHSSAVHYVYP